MPNAVFLQSWFRQSWFKLTRPPIVETHPGRHHTEATLENPQAIHRVDERFLSYSIDISVLAGGFWWEGALASRRGLGLLRIPPINLNNEKLHVLVAALGPAYLRIGGSEADKIHYFSAPAHAQDALILHPHTWDQLHEFKQHHNLKLVFTVKYGLFRRTQHGRWQDNEVAQLLAYCARKKQSIDVCELGNELNAYWAFHGLSSQPRAHHLAIDYHRFIETIKTSMPNCRIMGPGSAYWPKLGETIKPFSNLTKRFLQTCSEQGTQLDIVDWHYYPFQSLRSPIRTRTARLASMIKPKALNDFNRYSTQLKTWRDQYFPNAELWTGETGSAQCGGQPKLSDRFISCFWWADQLGAAARAGQSVVIRQSLVGGDYGLIDRLTLKPRPDFWLSWLWKQLMGREVYAITCPHHLVRAYCHNHADGEGKVVLLINLSAKPICVNVQGLGAPCQQWAITAKRLKSRKLRINGVKARYKNGAFSLQDFPQTPISNELPGHSIHFWLYRSEPHTKQV